MMIGYIRLGSGGKVVQHIYRFDSRRGLGSFLFTTTSRPALGPTQPPIQGVTRAVSLGFSGRGVKLTTHLHLLPRSNNEWSYTSTPPKRLHGVVLSLKKKAQGQLYFYLWQFRNRCLHSYFPNTIKMCIIVVFSSYECETLSVILREEALGYGLDDRGSRVRFPAGSGNFSLHHRVQNGSGAHPTSYPVGTRDSFPGGKAAGAWSWQLTSI
jgi:hypothetical protein